MKIVMISTVELARNGISTCILNYSSHIVSPDFQIDIVTPNIVSMELRNMLSQQRIGLFELPIRKENTLQYFLQLAKLIKKERYDIVHIHGNSCTVAIELAAAFFAKCKVRIAHSHNTTCEHKRAHKILRPLFECFCTTRFACGQDAGEWLFHNKEFTVIKNGVECNKYLLNESVRREIRAMYHVADDELLLGHVGLFNYQKNHDFLVRLIEKIKEKKIKCKLILIGDGEKRETIKKQIKEHGCEHLVIMPGSVSNVPDFLQAIDLFLLPSRFEGLPYVLVEAQASGLVSLVSDRVALESNITGYMKFLSLDSMDRWLEEITIFKEDGMVFQRKERIESGRRLLEDTGYSIEKTSQLLKQIYTRLAGVN